jgi:transcription elongation factor Elf1
MAIRDRRFQCPNCKHLTVYCMMTTRRGEGELVIDMSRHRCARRLDCGYEIEHAAEKRRNELCTCTFCNYEFRRIIPLPSIPVKVEG